MSHHTLPWHILSLVSSCALQKLMFCLLKLHTSAGRTVEGLLALSVFANLPGFFISQSWNTWKDAVPKLLRVFNMRLQSTSEFLYYLGNQMSIKHNCLILNILVLYIDGLHTYPGVPGTLLKFLLYPFLENYLVNSWRQKEREIRKIWGRKIDLSSGLPYSETWAECVYQSHWVCHLVSRWHLPLEERCRIHFHSSPLDQIPLTGDQRCDSSLPL